MKAKDFNKLKIDKRNPVMVDGWRIAQKFSDGTVMLVKDGEQPKFVHYTKL